MMITIHATCIAIMGSGVLLRGPSGSGKSDLALRLIDQGASLIGDDYCEYHVHDGELFASPKETIAGLIEVRELGIVRLPYLSSVPIRLVVDLRPSPTASQSETIERLPCLETVEIAGVRLPLIHLYPFQCSATAKVRLAVRLATGIIEFAS